jgi:hypothetical protein
MLTKLGRSVLTLFHKLAVSDQDSGAEEEEIEEDK